MIRRIFDYLEITSVKFAGKTAYMDSNRSVTFAQLRTEAFKVAACLISCGLKKRPVVVFMEKSVSCIASFLGAAYSGNFYSPIDIKMPSERVSKIVNTLHPALVITDQGHLDLARNCFPGLTVYSYEDIISHEACDDQTVLRAAAGVIDTDILYVLFTSGSTGQPKGVIISHRAAVDFIEWISECYHFDEHTVFGNQAQLYFDLSVQDVFAPIRNGSTTVLIPNRLYVSPVRVWNRILETKVNTLVWIPSMLSLFANMDVLRNVKKAPLKAVLFCGEVMPMKQLNYWIQNYPEVVFANLYGPTECTEACTYYTIDRTFRDEDVLPMGFACDNSETLVVDDEGKAITESGRIGELLMRGTCLSDGYYGNKEKTEEAFIQNPLHSNYPDKVYKTGDLVYYNERRELVYVSRKDFQVKIHGYRVELGEIEAAASAVSEIEYVCCVFDSTSEKLILAYKGNIASNELNEALQKKLQSYMIPAEYHQLPSMPFNLNGKVDREKIKKTFCK